MKGEDSVAQLVEQYTFNVWVLGSSPSGITKLQRKLELFLCEYANQACFNERMKHKKVNATLGLRLKALRLLNAEGTPAE